MSYEPGQTIFFDPQLYKEDTISYYQVHTYYNITEYLWYQYI